MTYSTTELNQNQTSKPFLCLADTDPVSSGNWGGRGGAAGGGGL